MKITVLGCNGPHPTKESGCSGFLIESGSGTKVVVDLGAGTLTELLERTGVEDIDAAVLTHLHFDHMSDMLVMEYCLQFSGRRDKLPVYVPEGPAHVRKCLECPYYELVPHAREFRVKDIAFTTVPAVHPVPGISLRAQCGASSIAVTGDTVRTAELDELCRGASLLVADCAVRERDRTDRSVHMSAWQAGDLASCCGAGQLVLTHFFPGFPPEEARLEAAERFPAAQAAYRGLSITV